jgi:hypothetical protein
VSASFAPGTTLAFGRNRVAVDGPYTAFATADGPDNTARLLIDQTVDWTYAGALPVRAHVLFQRPPRFVRARGPIRHYIEEKWAITTNGAAPSLPGSLITSFGDGVDRNQTNYFYNLFESPQAYMPSGASQVVRTTGQQIRVRYQAALTVSAAGGAGMDLRSYWHNVFIVTTPEKLL